MTTTTTYLVFVLVCWIPICAEIYLNKWAVHVDGGPAAAQSLANSHGFHYMGQVSLIDYYQSKKLEDLTLTI